MLGYNVSDDTRDFSHGEVKRYATSDMKYPCYVICVTPEKPLKSYTIDVLKRMFIKTDKYVEGLEPIHLYFNDGIKTVGFGIIQPGQVKPFMTLFEQNEVKAFLSEDRELVGDMRYVLSE